jgi:hypothetical protein
VQELGESEDGGGGNLLGVFNIDGIRVDQVHEFLGQLLGWSADVQWEGHEELSGFLSLDFLLLDQVEDELDGWVISGHDESVQEDIAGGLLLLGLVLGGNLAVKSLVLAVWKTAEDAGNSGDLGDGFSLSKRLLGVLNVLNDFLHQVLDTVSHTLSLESRDEHLGKWWVGQRWHWKEFTVLSIGVVHFIALVSPFLGFLRGGGRFLGLGDGAWATGFALASLVLLLLLLLSALSLALLLALVGLRVIFLGRFTALALTAVVPLLGVSVTTGLLLLALLLSLLFSGVAVFIVLLEDISSSEGVLELALTLELLFLWVEGVSQIMDLLWVLNLLNLAVSLGDLLKGQVLDGVGEDLLFESVSAVGLFVLNNVQDGVLFAIATASQEAGVDGTFPDGSDAVVTEARVEESSRGGESEDWLVSAGGEVDGFHNLVDLISLLAESLESLWPWDFSLDGLVAVFSGSGVLSLGQLLVGSVLLEVLVVLVTVAFVFLRALFAAALGLFALGVLLFRRAGAGVVLDWLSLSLELEWSVEGSVLADGVVGLAFTVNGLFHGLIEESGFLVGVVWTNLVGFAVQVASNDNIDACGVQNEMGDLSFLHVDSPGWETAVDLDGVDNTLSHSHFNGRLEVFLELSLDLNWVLVLKDSVSPATIDFGVDFDSTEVDWLQVDSFWSDNGQLHLVFNLESRVLGVLAESSENTSTNIVSVGVSHFPGVVGGDVPCKAERD